MNHPAIQNPQSKLQNPPALFPTITPEHAARYLARARSTPNTLRARLKQLTAKHAKTAPLNFTTKNTKDTKL